MQIYEPIFLCCVSYFGFYYKKKLKALLLTFWWLRGKNLLPFGRK